jgi:hypothetical protein
MFLISLLRPVKSWILTTKRLLFRESAEVIQYYQGAVESLQEQFQQLSRRPQIAKSQVDELFKAKKDLIAERFNHFASFHKNDPKTKEKVDRYKDEIVGKLQTLESNVMSDLNELFNSKSSEIYLNRHGDRYRQILQAHQLLSGQTPTNPTVSGTPQASSPQRPKPPETTPPTKPIERAPLPEISGEKLALATLTIAGLFQNIPTAKYKPPFSLERKEVNKTFDSLSKNWGDVDSRFSEEFLTHIGNTPGNISFLKKAVQHPQQLKDLVRALYDEYKNNFRGSSPSDMRKFFTRLGTIELSAQTIRGAHEKLLEEFRKDEIREEWDREMEKHPERPNVAKERAILFGLDSAINARRLPTKEQLIGLQSMIRFIEKSFLNGESLKWASVKSSSIFKEEAFQKNTNDGLYKMLRPRIITIQEKNISVRNEVSKYEEIDIFCRTICHFEGQDIQIDLPKILDTLQRLSQTYPFVFENEENVNLLQIQLEKLNSEELQKKINLERHLSLVRAFGISDENKGYYRDFTESLGNLLNERNPLTMKPPQEWANQINRMQINQNIINQRDRYRFLTLVRMYLNTRTISSKEPMTLSSFAEGILSSNAYMTITSSSVDQNLLETLNEEQLFPALTEIYNFIKIIPSDVHFVHIDGDIKTSPWKRIVKIMNRSERDRLTSNHMILENSIDSIILHDSNSRIVDIQGRADNKPVIFFSENILNRYHELKLTNPLFRELVMLGETESTSATIFEVFDTLFGSIRVANN